MQCLNRWSLNMDMFHCAISRSQLVQPLFVLVVVMQADHEVLVP